MNCFICDFFSCLVFVCVVWLINWICERFLKSSNMNRLGGCTRIGTCIMVRRTRLTLCWYKICFKNGIELKPYFRKKIFSWLKLFWARGRTPSLFRAGEAGDILTVPWIRDRKRAAYSHKLVMKTFTQN